MKNFWQQLNDRERYLVGIAGVCCFCYLFYIALYSPLIHTVESKQQELLEKKATLLWMRDIQQQQKKQPTLQHVSNAKLLAIISNQLNKTTLHYAAYQLQQTASGDIQLSFEKVPYNDFMQWLWSIDNHYIFSIHQLNIETTDTSGVVKLLLVMSAE